MFGEVRPMRSRRRTVGIDVGGTKTLGLLVEHGPAGWRSWTAKRVPSRADDPSAVDAVVGSPAR